MEYRIESDLLGELQVPAEAYYGVQTQRGINNYKVSNLKMSDFPEYIIAMAYIKLAAVEANHELGVINDEISAAIAQACQLDVRHRNDVLGEIRHLQVADFVVVNTALRLNAVIRLCGYLQFAQEVRFNSVIIHI